VPPARGRSAAASRVRRQELGTFDGVSRDLRETPYRWSSICGVEDGAQVIEGGSVRRRDVTRRRDARRVRAQGPRSEAEGARDRGRDGTPAVRDDVLFPRDYIKNVNRGRIELQDFNVGIEIAKAEAIAAEAKGGKDPFKNKIGDFERHYLLQGANEIMPYRVYVPKGYSASKPNALVIALHGLGGNEDGFFDNYDKLPPQLAEQHNLLLASPLGFRRDGFYGSQIMNSGADVAAKRRGEYSEKDVLEVLRLMKAAYNVDDSRIYLMGHSMGAIGTWALAAKYPETWAALVTFAGTGRPDEIAPAIKHLPQFVVHGDADNTVNVSGSRNMVAKLKELNANVTYIEVPGGSHTDVVVPNLAKAFDFMAAQRKGIAAGTKQ
jgi:predicted esterase